MEEYLSKFKEKHGLTDEECKEFATSDMIYDIDTDMPEDAFRQWVEYRKEHPGTSFPAWTAVDNGYMPDYDNSSMKGLRDELMNIALGIERSLDELIGSIGEDSDFDDSDLDFDDSDSDDIN